MDVVAEAFLLVGSVAVERDGDVVVVLIVADEVDDADVILLGVDAQAAAELLDKDDRRVGRADHDDLVDRGAETAHLLGYVLGFHIARAKDEAFEAGTRVAELA